MRSASRIISTSPVASSNLSGPRRPCPCRPGASPSRRARGARDHRFDLLVGAVGRMPLDEDQLGVTPEAGETLDGIPDVPAFVPCRDRRRCTSAPRSWEPPRLPGSRGDEGDQPETIDERDRRQQVVQRSRQPRRPHGQRCSIAGLDELQVCHLDEVRQAVVGQPALERLAGLQSRTAPRATAAAPTRSCSRRRSPATRDASRGPTRGRDPGRRSGTRPRCSRSRSRRSRRSGKRSTSPQTKSRSGWRRRASSSVGSEKSTPTPREGWREASSEPSPQPRSSTVAPGSTWSRIIR